MCTKSTFVTTKEKILTLKFQTLQNRLVYSLPCLQAVQYTVYLVWKLYSIQSTLFTSCKVNILLCLQAVQCTVYLVYKLDSVQCTLRISCTVYTVQQILWRNYRVYHEMFTHARYLREHWTGWNVLL